MRALESHASCFFKPWGQPLTAGQHFSCEHTFPLSSFVGWCVRCKNCLSCFAEMQQLLHHRGLRVLHHLSVAGLEKSEGGPSLVLRDGDMTCPGKEIITQSALPSSGLEPKMSLHHKSREEEEGGMTSPSCSREHKGDETLGNKLSCSGNFPSLAFLKASSVSPTNQAIFCLTPLVRVHSPTQPGPVPVLPAQPSFRHLDLCSVPPRHPPHCSSSTFWHCPPSLHLLVFCPSTVQGLSLGSVLGYVWALG